MAIDFTPWSRQARATRTAISPRLAMSTDEIFVISTLLIVKLQQVQRQTIPNLD